MKVVIRALVVFLIFAGSKMSSQNFVWGNSIGTTGINEFVDEFCVDDNMNSYLEGGFRGTVDFDPGPGTYTLISSGSGTLYDAFIVKYDPSGNLVWAKQLAKAGVGCITTDQFGNVIMSGGFAGTVDFDMNSGVSNMTSGGGVDLYFAKYDPAGNLLFSKSIGGNNSNNFVSSIYLDKKNGFIYMTGTYSDSCDFDPSINKALLMATGNEDIFFAKYDFNFNFIWAKGIGNMNSTVGRYITADSLQNVYICGSFSDSLDFNPDPLVNIKTPPSSSPTSYDTYFAKYDINGNYVFAKTIRGRDAGDIPAGIIVNRQLDIYVVGVFSDVVDFDYGPGTYTLNTNTNNSRSTYIAKYNNSGNLLWVKDTKVLSLTSSVEARLFTTDHYERLFITGLMHGSADFDPSISSTILTATLDDAFMAAYDPNGNYLLANNIGGSSNDQGVAIHPSKYGNYIYMTGQYWNSIDLDPSTGTSIVNAVGGGYDYFYSKYEFNAQTGIKEFYDNTQNITLFPVPASGQINISSKNEIKDVVLYNVLGEKLSEFNITDKSSKVTLELNYPAGIYFLKVVSGNQLVTKKIIIQ